MSGLIVAYMWALLSLGDTPKQAVEILNKNDIPAELTENGFVIFMPELLFEMGSSEITSINKGKLSIISRVLELNGIDDDVVYIEGHASKIGGEDYNISLSQKRADKIKDQLVNAGMRPIRIYTKGMGYSTPRFEPPENEKNQRVEIVVVDIN